MRALPLPGARRDTLALRHGPSRLCLLVAVASVAAVAGEPLQPPELEDSRTEIRPATFETGALARGPTAAALPLSGKATPSQPAAAVRSSLRPLGDWTVLAAIGAAFALVAAFRFTSRPRTKSLPPDVFELLGEASLGGQQTARVVRFGSRTLLISVSSAGCQTLAALDDAQATERIVIACRTDLPAGRGGLRSRRPPPSAQPEPEAA
jgi:hypothetical protein